MMQSYVHIVDVSGNGSSSGSRFLPSVVNPGPRTINQTYASFLIFTQGFDRYGFLNASMCEVILKLTTVHINYYSDLISSVPTSPTPLQSENVQLLSSIAGVAKYQTINSHGLVSSAVLDILYTIYSSMTHGSIDDTLDQTEVYLELLSFRLYCLFPPHGFPRENAGVLLLSSPQRSFGLVYGRGQFSRWYSERPLFPSQWDNVHIDDRLD
ncbi:hypothetical protein F4604DRAFT_331382 [Suillus subluteus]|nr:hypothetical protein F4604DRAFT_331382 [Suillus subluteus]